MIFRRLTLAAFLVVVLLVGFSPVQAQKLDGYDAYVYTPILSLRSSPSGEGNVIVTLQRGDRMNIDGRDSSSVWLHVKTEYNQVGWVAKPYLYIASRVIISQLPVLAGNPGGGSGGSGPTVTPRPGQPTPTPAPTKGGNPPAPIVTGKVGGRFELGGQVQDLGRAADAMRRSGMKWVKRQASAGDGASGMIGEAHGAGFKILLSVIGNRGQVMDDGYQNSYAGYVADLAGAGADAIEIWNEENIDREWPTGQISPAAYVKLLAKSYNAIKARNPGTMVIIGALAPTGAESYFGLDRAWNDDRYTRGLAAAGAGRYADCVGIHYNEGIVGPYQSSGDPRDNYPTRYFYPMLARGRAGIGLPACFTELGYLSPQGFGPLPGGFGWAANTTVAQQAAWLAQAAVRASGSGAVRLMIVFNVDFKEYGADPQAGYAIIRPDGSCLACDALGRVAR